MRRHVVELQQAALHACGKNMKNTFFVKTSIRLRYHVNTFAIAVKLKGCYCVYFRAFVGQSIARLFKNKQLLW